MATVSLDEVSKQYPNGVVALHEISLDVSDREFLVLVGPSGCGKSTALRTVAGLEDATEGEIRIDGRRVNEVAPKNRDIAMVFQNYALYPHMTVAENIGFALKVAKLPKGEIKSRIQEAAALLELENELERKPQHLSGGQRQRVAMGRAIVRRPSVFLMDEPLSNLDAKLRVQMRAEIARLTRELETTTIYVTHDQVEAMTMADRVAVLNEGRLQQVGEPQHLYDCPTNVFVASFIGSPSMNLYKAEISGNDLLLGSQKITIPDAVIAARPALREIGQGSVIVGIRAEDFEDAQMSPDPIGSGTLRAKVSLVEALGSELMVHFNIDATRLDLGDKDSVDRIGSGGNAVGRFNVRSKLSRGDDIVVAISVEKIHLFDSETHLNLLV